MPVAFAYLAVGLMSCLVLPLGLLAFSLRKKKKKEEDARCEPSLFWQFKKLEILALNLEDGREYAREAVRTIIAAVGKLQEEVVYVRGCAANFPEQKRRQLLTDLERIEKSCTVLMQSARCLEARCMNRDERVAGSGSSR